MLTKVVFFPVKVLHHKKNNNEKVNMFVLMNGCVANCLLDTGVKKNHIISDFCKWAKIAIINKQENLHKKKRKP